MDVSRDCEKGKSNCSETELGLRALEQNCRAGNKYWYAARLFRLFSMGVSKSSAFLFPAAQASFLSGEKVLGGLCILGLLTENSISYALGFMREHFKSIYNKHNELDVEEKANKIFNLTRGKVTRKETINGNMEIEKKVPNVEILRACSQHIRLARERRDARVDSVMDVVSTIAMVGSALFIGAKNTQNVPLFLGIAGASLCGSGLIALKEYMRTKKFFRESWRLNNDIEKGRHDLINVRPLNNEHIEFLQRNYIESTNDLLEKQIENEKRTELTD